MTKEEFLNEKDFEVNDGEIIITGRYLKASNEVVLAQGDKCIVWLISTITSDGFKAAPVARNFNRKINECVVFFFRDMREHFRE
jgi:hypothetical protein